MTGFLLDTNILSELRRSKPEPKVLAFVGAQPLETLFVSSVTFAEIRFGIELIADVHKRAALTEWLDLQLRPMFESRVLPVSEDVMFKWRLRVEEGRKVGHTFPQPDLIIAATALHHGLTIVSRDTAGYAKTGVPLVNPWEQESPAPLRSPKPRGK
jgi:predicted nucleic acid-binding protein